MRVDKFLKVSRILKRRSVAADACDNGKVIVNGKEVKPSYRLKIGDVVTIAFLSGNLTFTVKGLNEKANKEEVRELYEIN